MISFLALYRGDDVKTAKLITVTADPGIISRAAEQLLAQAGFDQTKHPDEDPILGELHSGRDRALELMSRGL